MRSFYKAILLLGLALFLLPGTSKATHVMGSDITWDNIGKDSFEVTLTVYRDCTGINLARPNLNIGCDSGGSVSNITQTSTSYNNGKDITPICDQSNSECGGSGFGYGIEEHKVTYIVDLSNSSCCKVNFNYSECCRSNSITTGLDGDQYYAESWFNRCKAPQNSSPDFSEKPTGILCVNRQQVYTQGAVDSDTDSTGQLLDSLSYQFARPLGTGPNDPLNYNNPYSYDKPLQFRGFPNANFPSPLGFRLNNETGDLSFTPTQVQTSVFSIQVNEYRNVNGKRQKISEVRRDVQFFVKNCPANSTPSITGMDCPKNVRIKSVCEGDLISTGFCTSDPDTTSTPEDSTEISFNPGNLPSAASFQRKNPGKKVQFEDGTFKWTPTEGDASPIPYRFSVTAKDDNCPVAGKATRTFQIKVNPSPKVEITATNKGCGTYQFTTRTTNRAAVVNYQWRGSNSDLSGSGATLTHTFEEPGKYPYRLKVTSAKGCSRVFRDTVELDPFLRVDIGSDTTICSGESLQLGGIPRDTAGKVSYTWHDSVTGKRNRTFSNLTSDTTLSLTIKDTVCDYTDVVEVDVRDKPEVDLGVDPRICADDTATISPGLLEKLDSTATAPYAYVDGGQQAAGYKWFQGSTSTPAFSKADTVKLSQQGTYFLQVTDTFSCAGTDSLDLKTNPELKPEAFPPRICREDTSTLKAQKTGGSAVSYTWINLKTRDSLTGRQVDVSPDSNTRYALVIEETTKGVFCRDSATTTVEVEALPEVRVNAQQNICANEDPINLNDSLDPNQSVFSGVWKSGDLPAGAITNGAVDPQQIGTGQYTVRFEWTEPRGTGSPRCTNVDSAELNVRPTPTVDAGTDTIICTHEDPLQLEGSPASPAGDWSGDGVSNAEDQQSLSYDPASSQVPTGVNTLAYTYTEPNYGCTTTDEVQVTVQQSPTPDYADKELCIDQNTLNLKKIANKGTWSGSNVDNNGIFNTPDQPGSYEGRYEVSTNTYRTCEVEDVIDITVKDTPAVQAATASGEQAFCESRTSVQLQGSPASGGTGQWESVDGEALIEGSSIFNPSGSNEGENRVAYVYEANSTGCSNSDTMTLEVDPQPEVSVLETDTSKCRGASYRLTASYDNTSRIPIWQSTGRAELAGFDDISSEDKVVSTNYAPSDKEEDEERFTAKVRAVNNGACPKAVDSVTVNIKPVPRPDFSTDNQGCPPFDVAYNNKTTISEGGRISGYEWKLGNGQRTEAETPQTTYQSPGQYTVSLRAFSAQGCEATMTKEDFIRVSKKPEIDFAADPVLTTINASKVDFENLSSGDNKPLTYQWRLGRQERTGAITTSAEAPDYRYNDTGNYTIRLAVTNSKGCTDSLVREDYVRIKPTVINYAPSAFSPNDDGTNDVYRVEARYFTDFSIQIFNRWGEQVYSADDYETHGWDGTYEGEKAPGGVYTYVVKATGMDGEDYTFSGTITLIR